jgi:hypothetical protein
MARRNRFISGKEATGMSYSRQGSVREQMRFLRRQFLQDGGLPFTDILSGEVISQALKAIDGFLDRIYSPLTAYAVSLHTGQPTFVVELALVKTIISSNG